MLNQNLLTTAIFHCNEMRILQRIWENKILFYEELPALVIIIIG